MELMSSSDEESDSPTSLSASPAAHKRPQVSASQDSLEDELLSPSNARVSSSQGCAGPKRVVSARELLMSLLPPGKQRPNKAKDGAVDAAVAAYSLVTPQKPTAPRARRKEEERELTAGERIARKYGLVAASKTSPKEPTTRKITQFNSTSSTPGSVRRFIGSQAHSRKETAPVEETPAAKPKKRSFWDAQTGGVDAEQKHEAKSTYVSPFSGPDGFINPTEEMTEEEVKNARDAFYDDSKGDAQDIGPRPRHIIGSAIPEVDDADEWFSDSKEMVSEEEEVAVKDDGKRSSLRRQRPKRVQKELSDSSEEEKEAYTSEKWPQLDPPKRGGVDFLHSAYQRNTGAILGDDMGLGKTIQSYDILKMYLNRLHKISWEMVILDEMHCLKNPEAQLTKAVKAIKCKRRFGLTGTLMQNNEKELHCLLDTIAPGALGSWAEFSMYYGNDIKYGRKKSAAPEAVKRSHQKEKELREKLLPYYLRREKDINPTFQVVKKNDQVVFCDLTPLQMAAYERVLAMPEFELIRQGEEKCDCGRDSKLKRKQCCYKIPMDIGDTPGLLYERFHERGPCKNCPNCMGLINPHESTEVQHYQREFAKTAFGDDLDAVGGVNQVSSFQEMYSRLDGNTKVEERLQMVNDFNSPESNTSVFLISTRAGGVGLNLQSATNVVIFDPSWNPAHDCQAQDRAYRIGQTKDVQVYRLITLGTIEEMMYVRQIYKQQLSDTTLKGANAPRYFEGVQGNPNQRGELFGLKNLLCWKVGGVLKGIQDSYQRSREGLLVQQNRVRILSRMKEVRSSNGGTDADGEAQKRVYVPTYL
uniref:Helicase C-terminal domain-containing protein n=1 Tax=Phytophthora ramorum TaxID=164328 RepID=H3HDF9_PHYRM